MIKLGKNIKNKIALSDLLVSFETTINVDFNNLQSSRTWDFLHENLTQNVSDSLMNCVDGVYNEIV